MKSFNWAAQNLRLGRRLDVADKDPQWSRHGRENAKPAKMKPGPSPAWTPGGGSVFWEGPKFFNFVHFSRESTPIFKSCIKIQENWVAVDLMVNALQSTWNLDRNNLHAYVRQCAHPFDLSFTYLSFSCLVQSFDVRMPLFLSHSWIPAFWWVNNTAVGGTVKGVLCWALSLFSSYQCWSCANTDSVMRYG